MSLHVSSLLSLLFCMIITDGPFVFINPQCMLRASVCLSITTLYSCYIPRLYIEIEVTLGFLCRCQRMNYVDFIDNSLFKCSGDIYWPPRPSSLLDQLTINKRSSDGFFSKSLVCRTSDSSCYLADLSLIVGDYHHQPTLALCSKNCWSSIHVHGHAV